MCSRLALHMATSPTRGVPCLPHIHPPPWQQAVFGFFECLSQGLLTFIYIYMSPFQSARGDIFLRLGGVRRSNPGWGWGWGWESGQMGPRTRVLLYSGLNGENSSTPELTMGSPEPPPPPRVGGEPLLPSLEKSPVPLKLKFLRSICVRGGSYLGVGPRLAKGRLTLGVAHGEGLRVYRRGVVLPFFAIWL